MARYNNDQDDAAVHIYRASPVRQLQKRFNLEQGHHLWRCARRMLRVAFDIIVVRTTKIASVP
jgi:hypothetical protein